MAETPNLWIKEKFGLRQFSVRGLSKVGDRGVVGLSDLQHLRMDSSALETNRSGGDPRVKRRRKRSCRREIGELEHSVSSSSRSH